MPRNTEKQARTTQLKALLQEKRGPIRNWIEEATNRGIFTDELFEKWKWDGAKEEIRKAANTVDKVTGERTALVVKGEDGEPATTPLQLALFSEAEEVLLRLTKSIDADYNSLVMFRDWMVAKYGHAPEIPKLGTPETVS